MSYTQLSRKDQESKVVGAADHVEPNGKYCMGLTTKKYGRVYILEQLFQGKKSMGRGEEQNRFLFNLLNIKFKNPYKNHNLAYITDT